MAKQIAIGKSADFIEGKGRTIIVSGKELAIFRHNGQLGCIGNRCLHAGGPLSIGEIKNGRVYCPWHNWDWDFQTGTGFTEESTGGYKIWEEGGKVYINLTEILAEPLKPSDDF